MKILELTSGERPRERLLASGPGALSDGELLAVILRSGTSSQNVLELSRGLLSSCGGSLVRLSQMSCAELRHIPGIKDSKAAVILAAVELGRRFASERAASAGSTLTGARAVYDMMIPYMKGLGHEESWVILLDKRQRVMARERLCSGTADGVQVDPLSTVRLAVGRGARALVLVHNHPAGDPTPSKEDIDITKRLSIAANACGLLMLDHIVVCDSCFYSFCDERTYRVPSARQFLSEN